MGSRRLVSRLMIAFRSIVGARLLASSLVRSGLAGFVFDDARKLHVKPGAFRNGERNDHESANRQHRQIIRTSSRFTGSHHGRHCSLTDDCSRPVHSRAGFALCAALSFMEGRQHVEGRQPRNDQPDDADNKSQHEKLCQLAHGTHSHRRTQAASCHQSTPAPIGHVTARLPYRSTVPGHQAGGS